MQKIILLMVSTIIFNCCSGIIISGNHKIIKGSGKVIDKTFTVGDFDEIINSSIFNIELTLDEKTNVVASIDDNLISYLHIELKNNCLHIYQDDTVNMLPTKGIIKISIPALVNMVNSGTGNLTTEKFNQSKKLEIKNTGMGDIYFKKVKADKMAIFNTGTGQVKMEGDLTSLELSNTGTGEVQFIDLDVDTADINNTGTGDVSIAVNKELSLVSSGTGDIKYKGNPEIKKMVNSGTGNVKKIQ